MFIWWLTAYTLADIQNGLDDYGVKKSSCLMTLSVLNFLMILGFFVGLIFYVIPNSFGAERLLYGVNVLLWCYIGLNVALLFMAYDKAPFPHVN